ncbi:MAG TPA: tetratricopeptide repeat protein [Thermoanaerobaculia bacterium]|nr:tetratricopeptide repeat protein [Thermoanaerobaculia bacterium]
MKLPPAAELVALFRKRFADDPRAAYRDWFVLQEHLRDEATAESLALARTLASDLWDRRETVAFSSKGEEATFLHNLAVFFGSRGPAESLERSLSLFEESLDAAGPHGDLEAWARAWHNRGNALQNLARTAGDLRESLVSYERALTVRDGSRRIARGVTLHALGTLLRKLAEAEPLRREAHLRASVCAFEESLSLRSEEGLERGMAETAAALADARRAISSGC